MIELRVDVDPKMLRETLCLAQTALGDSPFGSLEGLNRLQLLIDECDRHRPLGPDGKHGDRHTATCGCEDKQLPVEHCRSQMSHQAHEWHKRSLKVDERIVPGSMMESVQEQLTYCPGLR